MRRWPTLTMLLLFGLNPPITTNTLKALSLTLGSNATCIAAIDHHPGEKAIGSMPLSVCSNTDSALALSRSENSFTESSNRTFHPLESGAEDELAGMEDQRRVLGDVDQLGQILLVLADVDHPTGVVTEEPKVAIDVQIH